MADKSAQANGKLIEEARRRMREREKTYREQALKMYPWVCGRCGREFSGKRLSELTVHHKDHNHDNNPPDGSNWELLCIYCHDEEHSRYTTAQLLDQAPGPSRGGRSLGSMGTLGDLLKAKLDK